MQKQLRKILNNKSAQTAIEIALFAGVIVFIVGLIVRQAYNTVLYQNRQLGAIRKAMFLSMSTSRGEFEKWWDVNTLPASSTATVHRKWGNPPYGFPTNKTVGARNAGSVLLIEDRLTPTVGKYGPTQRTPFIAQGGATFSQNLYLPVDPGEDWNLPRFDVIVNGQHFVLSMSGFRFLQGLSDPSRYPEIEWMDNCVVRPAWDFGDFGSCPGGTGEVCFNFRGRQPEISLGCRVFYKRVNNLIDNDNQTEYCYEDCQTYTANNGMQYYRDDPVNGTARPEGCCDVYRNLTANERFDLDRNGTTDVPVADRKNFAWQWKLVKGVHLRSMGAEERYVWGECPYCGDNDVYTCHPFSPQQPPDQERCVGGMGYPAIMHDNFDKDPTDPKNFQKIRFDVRWRDVDPTTHTPLAAPTSDSRPKCAWHRRKRYSGSDDPKVNSRGKPKGNNFIPYGDTIVARKKHNDYENNVLDIDGDLEEETLLDVGLKDNLLVDFVYFMDNEAGDFDSNAFGNDKKKEKPGLQKEMRMYSFTKDGTYLQLDQGNWIDPQTGNIVRSVQKRDRIDFVERVFQLSNDTGHLCGNGTPEDPTEAFDPSRNPIAIWDTEKTTPNFKQNPDVRACACQHGSGNFYSYDPANPPGPGWTNCGAIDDTDPDRGSYSTCFVDNAIHKTCFDEDTNILYIRTHLKDMGGMKWLNIENP